MTKNLTMVAALAAAMMFVSQAPVWAQADAAGSDQGQSGSDAGAAAGAGQTGSDQAGSDAAAAQPAAGREGQAGQSGQVGEKDRRFVMKAASSGLFEVASSQLAQQQAQSQEIKRFAQRMVEDHQRANKQLQQIAQRKGIQIPQDMLPVHKACLQDLQQHKGRDFERAYLIEQVAEHNKAVLKFRDASTELQDSDLKQFASQTLPILREHLTHVEQLAGVDDETTAGSRQGAREGEGAGSDPIATPPGGDRESAGEGAGSQQTPGSDAGSSSDAGSGAGGAGASDAGTDRNSR